MQNIYAICRSAIGLFCLSILTLNANSQVTYEKAGSTSGRGLVKGVVKDGISNSPLPGAIVRVIGTNRGDATNLLGEYTISIPTGTHEVRFSYLGYKSVISSVTVEDGQTVTLDAKLDAGAESESREILVTASIDGQAKALNQQRSADNIKNIVAAEQIGRFPDPNVAEALQRVPGVNLFRDEGEGRYVLVRGLAPQFTNVSINGEQIPSPEDGVRYMALDAIPADQLATMEVTKSITPDMDGDAIGGNINLITRGALYKDLKVSGSLASEYNNLMRRAGGQGTFQISQRLGQRSEFGYLINSNFYISRRGSDKVEPTDYDFDESPAKLTELELRDYEINRNRLGLSSTFDYRFNQNNEVYFRTLYSQLYEREYRRRIRFFAEDGEVVRETKDRPEQQGVLSLNLGGRHFMPTLNLDYEIAFSRANQNTDFDKNGVFEQKDLTIDFNQADPLKPLINVTDEDGAAVNFNDNSRYTFKEFVNSGTTAKDDNFTTKFNVGIPFSLGNNPALFKFGAKARLKSKSFKLDFIDLFEYNGDDDLTLNRFEGGLTDDRFLNNDYRIGTSPDNGRVEDFIKNNRGDFDNGGTEAAAEERAVTEYEATENVYASYAMARVEFGKLMLLGGARYEFTDVKYKGSLWDADEEVAIALEETNSYGYLLPMLHARYAIDENTNIRAAATMTFARPNFADIFSEDREFVPGDAEASIGNYQIKPVKAYNLDFFAERYFGNVGILSAGLFYKRLDNFIYRQGTKKEYRGIQDVLVVQSINGETADLTGFEIAWQQNLTFLPGYLSGLGIYANYTFTNSKARVKNRADADSESEEIRLPGQSKHLGNFAISYSLGGFNARVSANFNGSFIEELGDNPSQDYYIDSRVQIDASATYNLSPNFSIFAEGVNLTNQRRVDYRGSLNTPLTREYYGFWTRSGIRITF